MRNRHSPFRVRPAGRLAVLAVAALALGACTVTAGGDPSGGIGYHQARAAELAAVRDWRSCRDQALALSKQARRAASPARYLASARAIEACEAGIGPEAADAARDERMRAYAASVLDHFKGGDLTAARRTLGAFESRFAGRDLHFADGASFIDTMRVLVGQTGRSDLGELAIANVNDGLKAELRRVEYWQRH